MTHKYQEYSLAVVDLLVEYWSVSAFYWIYVKAYTVMGICTVQYGKAIGLYNNYSIQRVFCSIQVPSMSLFILSWVVCVMLLLLAGDIKENPGPVKCRSLSMCHVNIRSLSRSKLLAIQTSVADLYDIITISESHLHQGIGNDVLTISGFHEILRKDRDGNGGGVAMYIRDNIAYKRHWVWICLGWGSLGFCPDNSGKGFTL